MSDSDQVRTAEVIASLCLATDLGMGFPFEHGLHATLTTMRLCDALGVDDDTASRTFYTSLLMYSGCTVDGDVRSEIFGGSMTEQNTHRQFGLRRESLIGVIRALPQPEARGPRRGYQVVTRLPRAYRFRDGHFAALCEVAGMLAERLGLPESIYGMFPLLTERWDGKSVLQRARGEEIPLPVRITQVARDATYQRLMGDAEHVVETIEERAEHAFDPHVARVFMDNALDILGDGEASQSVWAAVLDAEPKPHLGIRGEAIDGALAAMGAFSDLASPSLSGHASAVGSLAGEAARLSGFADDEVLAISRAGLLHDVGRSAVDPRIWEKSGLLTADEWEQVRLHPYHTERVLVRSPFLAPLARIASAHHERMDGSGYHRGLNAASLPPAARLLAAADAYRAKTEPRAYRDALDSHTAAERLVEKAKEGRLDADMVAAVIEAAGLEAPHIERPAGLTEREVEVVTLLARGMQTKQIARSLDISAKTADRHIQNAYRKMGVSSRAAATLFAVEHGLIR
jgi:HD-GYP domain-containing protein (c-di-GMP phosphodiesterase class II)